MGMKITMELPEACPVCDSEAIYVSFKKSKEAKDKEEATVWEETFRYTCGCVLEFSKDTNVVGVKTPCPNAHEVAVALREELRKLKKKQG